MARIKFPHNLYVLSKVKVHTQILNSALEIVTKKLVLDVLNQ